MRNNNPYKNYEQKNEVISLPLTPSFQHHYHLNMNNICPTFGGNYMICELQH
jgi:hypothetical protein